MSGQFPAEKLLNQTLSGGWVVTSRVKQKSTTGGRYSTCYIVKKENETGFLKAFDYRDLKKPGGKDQFNRLNAKYERERDLLKKCTEKNIATVVKYITSDTFYFVPNDINEAVEYFILEYSTNGSVQECLDNNDDLNDLAHKFKSLSDVFDGLNHLHSNGIMHLDVKPSNLLYFVDERLTKITDFGSARQWIGDLDESLNDDVNRLMTTRLYAPPEFLYDEPWSDWNSYRKKVDLYLAGNVIVKFFTNLSFSALLKTEMCEFDDWNIPSNRGKFKNILPNLISAANEVFLSIEQKILLINEQCECPLSSRDIEQLVQIIRSLCSPDPEQRGDPKSLRSRNQRDGLDRYRDKFITLQKKCEIRLRRYYDYNKLN